MKSQLHKMAATIKTDEFGTIHNSRGTSVLALIKLKPNDKDDNENGWDLFDPMNFTKNL